MEVRLQKYLADCGVASRRASEKLISSGAIFVNDKKVIELGTKIDTKSDVVKVNGEIISPEARKVYIMLNKPKGYVSTVKEQFDRPAVLELLKDVKERVVPVGRLDFDTSGLLLLTNDGDLVYKLTHPKHNIDKVYIAKVMGKMLNSEVKRLEEGIVINPDISGDIETPYKSSEISSYKTAPAKVRIIKADDQTSLVQISIREGKNRQVRKMFEAVDHRVLALKRVAVGELKLENLDKGQFRYLTDKEVDYLKNL